MGIQQDECEWCGKCCKIKGQPCEWMITGHRTGREWGKASLGKWHETNPWGWIGGGWEESVPERERVGKALRRRPLALTEHVFLQITSHLQKPFRVLLLCRTCSLHCCFALTSISGGMKPRHDFLLRSRHLGYCLSETSWYLGFLSGGQLMLLISSEESFQNRGMSI